MGKRRNEKINNVKRTQTWTDRISNRWSFGLLCIKWVYLILFLTYLIFNFNFLLHPVKLIIVRLLLDMQVVLHLLIPPGLRLSFLCSWHGEEALFTFQCLWAGSWCCLIWLWELVECLLSCDVQNCVQNFWSVQDAGAGGGGRKGEGAVQGDLSLPARHH